MAQTGRVRISARTFWNWLLDAAVLISGTVAALSGVYFLFLSSGYQGGRNPYYGIVILFERQTWSLIHMWSGVVMVTALLVHLVIHLGWIGMMARKIASTLRGRSTPLSAGARTNVLVDAAVALSFILSAVSGAYFLFVPHGGNPGGTVAGWDPAILVSRLTWDLIHTWSGVALILAALVHVAIHWRWITKVTSKVGRALAAAAPSPKQLEQNV